MILHHPQIGLKLSITKMIKLSTSKGDEPITFDDSYQEVSTLLSSIEKCVFHGMFVYQ
jgi:hypothetical protein